MFQKQCDMLLIGPTAPKIEFKSNKDVPTEGGRHAIQSGIGSVVDWLLSSEWEKRRIIYELEIWDLRGCGQFLMKEMERKEKIEIGF